MAKRTTTSSTRKRTTRKDVDRRDVATGNGQLAPDDVAPTEDDIRLRAYHRYLERGGGHGADFDDWLEAERDLKSQRHN
jgi:Protein of unknown function (DUF2934)